MCLCIQYLYESIIAGVEDPLVIWRVLSRFDVPSRGRGHDATLKLLPCVSSLGVWFVSFICLLLLHIHEPQVVMVTGRANHRLTARKVRKNTNVITILPLVVILTPLLSPSNQTPEDIYKSHLSETGGISRRRDGGGQHVDSARANLASTFVNAFVNAGYGQDQASQSTKRLV